MRAIEVRGASGQDTFAGATGGSQSETFLGGGGPGDDNMGGKLGLSSGRDDDQGADSLRGGEGTDDLALESHTGGVNITIDGQANDGAPGEGDNVAADFEHIDGTGADDTFTGSGGSDGFSGGGGTGTAPASPTWSRRRSGSRS